MLHDGVLDVVSSDHSGWGYDTPVGKRVNGVAPSLQGITNGVPGLAARLPIMFSESVSKGRMDAGAFARLTATDPAQMFGLYPRKGTIAPSLDADLVLWDPSRTVAITKPQLMQPTIDYTPYEGMQVIGWPVTTIRRGQVVMQDGLVQTEPGSGPVSGPRAV